ncbi:hypothetical protein Cs308_0895 [Candidatus Chlamydia sanziniae]|uniref:Uncharacterized protein n=1 Tax=Candidatus Chlamydia sanziniae TaxID=1806891 RepID=A0A1A9HW44_9CHLA|nr:hypothetical protein Cs308_0895 [Candidatus Chlamydia sanziniae]
MKDKADSKNFHDLLRKSYTRKYVFGMLFADHTESVKGFF